MPKHSAFDDDIVQAQILANNLVDHMTRMTSNSGWFDEDHAARLRIALAANTANLLNLQLQLAACYQVKSKDKK